MENPYRQRNPFKRKPDSQTTGPKKIKTFKNPFAARKTPEPELDTGISMSGIFNGKHKEIRDTKKEDLKRRRQTALKRIPIKHEPAPGAFNRAQESNSPSFDSYEKKGIFAEALRPREDKNRPSGFSQAGNRAHGPGGMTGDIFGNNPFARAGLDMTKK